MFCWNINVQFLRKVKISGLTDFSDPVQGTKEGRKSLLTLTLVSISQDIFFFALASLNISDWTEHECVATTLSSCPSLLGWSLLPGFVHVLSFLVFLTPHFSCLQRFLTKHYMQKERVARHPEKRLPMKLAVKKSENVEVYISSNNSLQALQGNRQKLSEWDIGALLLQTTRCDKTYLSHNALKKCVAWYSKERLPMIDISSYRVRK